MIKPTDEMVRAFSDADFTGLGNADWEDSHVRVGLAAVLALVERDYRLRRRVDVQVEVDPRWACHRCGMPLTRCEVCGEPALCGDAWCAEHMPGDAP